MATDVSMTIRTQPFLTSASFFSSASARLCLKIAIRKATSSSKSCFVKSHPLTRTRTADGGKESMSEARLSFAGSSREQPPIASATATMQTPTSVPVFILPDCPYS